MSTLASANAPFDDAADVPRSAATLRNAACAVSAGVIAAGMLVLFGWAIDHEPLQRLFAYGVTIKANTAFGLVLAGGAVLLRRDDVAHGDATNHVARALAVVVALLGIATLAQYTFAVDLGIDQLLVRAERDASRTATPGRMAAITAAAFALLGIGLATLDVKVGRRRPAHYLILATIALGLTAVLGYVYGAIPTAGLGQGIQIALPTAAGFILLGSAALALRPRVGWMRQLLSIHAGGMLARRMLPFAVVVPLALGALRALGSWTSSLSAATLSATFAVLTMLAFGVVIMRTSAALDDADRKREASEVARLDLSVREERARAQAAAEAAARDSAETARRAAEQLLREKAEALGLLDVVLAGAPVAFALFDRSARLVRVNAALASLGDDAPERCVGRTAADVVPQLAGAIEEGVRRVLATRETILDVALTLDVASHRQRSRHFLASYYPVALGDGELVGVGACLVETTEQLLLEAQLLQSQKMEAVGRLAGGIAHDFNNLLTVIGTYSDLLLKNTPAADHRHADLAEIRDAAARAAQLTRQLLAFSRNQVIEPRVLNANDVVHSTEKMLRRLIGEDVVLDAKLDPELANVLVDPGQLEQVLMNLVVNARDAMPEGGRITLETANVELSEDYAQHHVGVEPGPYVMLAVSDTGTGISPDVMAHLFEPFFTTKAPGQGTGLGLSTVYGIVKQSGGDIWVYSEVRHGTTFKVYLPRYTASAEAESTASVAHPAGGHETVLLVEDEDRLRQLAARVLRDGGYTVLEARDGTGAAKMARAHDGPIHLVLSDVVMPGANGRVVVELLTTIRPNARTLFMSGYTDDDVMRRGILARRTAFLQKPFTADLLLAKVREVLDAPSPAQ